MNTSAGAVSVSTIVARNYLPAAQVLAESYRRHHPGAKFTVLVVDAVEGEIEDREPIRFLTPADLDLDPDDFSRMAVSYTAAELCTALKPWLLLRQLIEHDVAIYLDPDIEVFLPFEEHIAEFAREFGIVLTPHVLEPIPNDGFRPTEADIMLSGVFNLGFIAVSRSAEGFLVSWSARMRQGAIVSPHEQLFYDQRWIDNVPALYRHRVVDDPGYNVAYWNVYQRPLERTADGVITAGGSPLRFLHYSGYRPEKPWLISIHYADLPRVVLSEHPLLRELFGSYRDRLIEAGYPQTVDTVPYRWARLPDGTPLSISIRRAFREAWVGAERRGELAPRGPFGADGAADFLSWATKPATAEQRRAGLSPWAMTIWRERADIQAAFPEPCSANATDFRNWCMSTAVAEGTLPVGAVPAHLGTQHVEPRRNLGVNVLGYLTTESGVGEVGRLVHEAVRASGLPCAVVVEDDTVINRTEHSLQEHVQMGDPEYGVSVLCVNADMTDITLRLHPEISRNRYLIGVWGWEVSDFPYAMHGAFAQVDEVWTYSDFCVEAIKAHASVPVYRFPIPVRDPLGAAPSWRPADGQTRFLFIFDHNSVFERKNPLGVVAAFQHAFGDRSDVSLTIKSINSDRHPADRERLRAAVAGDERVELIERYLEKDELEKLFASVDCYVSLHRSEGFGLTLAEAMAHGLPVIATDYSATREFLNDETGWPIPCRLVGVGAGHPPYPPQARWADPSIEAAAAALRDVVEHPQVARAKGEAARQHVLTTRPMEAAAAWIKTRIEVAHKSWLNRVGEQADASGPLGVVRAARHVVHTRPDVGAPSRVPGARALRRGVLRALDHHDNHQRGILDAILDAVETSVGDLVHRIDGLEKQLAVDRAQLAAASAERIDSLDEKLMQLLRGRDVRLDRSEQAINDLASELQRNLPALHEGLIRLHDVLHPVPEQPTAAVNTDVGMLRLPAYDTVMLPWLRHYGRWEVNEAALIDRLLPTGGMFVDIGAHVGYFTVRALRLVGPTGLVVAVEPCAAVRALLEHNVVANVPAEEAAVLKVLDNAAWDTDGPLMLESSAHGNTADNRISEAGSTPVTAIRLDGLASLKGRRIDVVKSGAQGNDHRALAGMTRLFESHRPHILCEFDPDATAEAGYTAEQVLATYRSWGYDPQPVTDELIRALEYADAYGSRLLRDYSDEELIQTAHDTTEGFVSLWLHPRGNGHAGPPEREGHRRDPALD